MKDTTKKTKTISMQTRLTATEKELKKIIKYTTPATRASILIKFINKLITKEKWKN